MISDERLNKIASAYQAHVDDGEKSEVYPLVVALSHELLLRRAECAAARELIRVSANGETIDAYYAALAATDAEVGS